ncbi:MAG TPA: hypothetical protein VEQ59_01595, partial [Polyangiaceae bacterium]|nr:hypothetical protein [Polyangiaceae bacterium]
LALINRRLTLVWLFAAWSFHVGVLTTMSIAFVYQLSGVAYLSFLPVEQLLDRLVARLQKSSVSPSGIAASTPEPSRSSNPGAHS